MGKASQVILPVVMAENRAMDVAAVKSEHLDAAVNSGGSPKNAAGHESPSSDQHETAEVTRSVTAFRDSILEEDLPISTIENDTAASDPQVMQADAC